jgi:RNA polymerase sigma factor (sigma-70 family)
MGEQDLIKASAKNDKSAQKNLFDQHYRDILLICKRYAKNNMQAKEMALAGMHKVFEQIKRFSNNDVSFSEWIKKIVIQNNIVILKSNMQEYYIVSTVKAIDNSLFVSANNSEEIENDTWFIKCGTEKTLSAIQHLPSSLRVTYNMHIIDGFSIMEVANTLEISEGTAISNLEKARHAMKRNLYLEYKSS